MAVWRPFTLLLLWIPGCLSLSCPSSVNGTIGGSLNVTCMYEKKYAEKEKYWCESSCLLWDNVIVRTSRTEREVTKDRVTTRDDPGNLTFTVTLERLRRADAGTYTCGISLSVFKFDPKVQVVVSIFPARQRGAATSWPSVWKAEGNTTTLGYRRFHHTPQATSASPETSAEPTVFTWPKTTQKEPPDLSPIADPEPSSGGSLLSSIYFWILIFLEVPMLLGMMVAVLWVTWPRSTPRHLPNTSV